MEWEFLYDRTKHLLTIGYKPEEQYMRISGFCDLLASEASVRRIRRHGSYGAALAESWFALDEAV